MIEINGKWCWPSRGAAELLGIGRNTMLRELRNRGVYGKANLPIDDTWSDYFVVDHVNRGGFVIGVSYITQEGLDYIRELLKDVPKKKEKPYKELFDSRLAEVIDTCL